MKPQKGFAVPLAILAIAILIALGAYVYFQSNSVKPTVNPEPVACTADAKQCTDGSFVGRVGPNCEFVCPTIATSTNTNIGTSTNTSTSTSTGTATSTASSTNSIINSIPPNSRSIGLVI